MLTEQQVSNFHRDGFLNAGRLLEDAEVQRLSDDLDRIIAIGPKGFESEARRPVKFGDIYGGTGGGTGGGTNTVWQIVNVWEASPQFEQLIYHPLIVEATSQLTGFRDLQVWHDQVQYKPPTDGGSTTWHQDAPLWPSIEPMTPVSAWIPFDDASVENGCMWMVPGSHEWGNQIEYLRGRDDLVEIDEFGRIGEDFEPAGGGPKPGIRAVPCPVQRGEVHFHHSLTWHGSPKNHSTRPRRALAIHYMTSEAVFTGRDHVMRQFIGVDVGERMLDAGDHFPIVCRNGEAVAAPATA
ncbi:MAG: phytanoyl-CoA dioxygenase family protein [Phycisphaeraceae bacterium]|nr:phytanoyl-CoA dioxygenase family protein [Phycisphaeraceae bacterium]